MNDNEAAVNQTVVESGALSKLGDAIRAAIAMPFPRRQPGRKVATVRYLCQLYRQMLERVLAIEENDGYMDLVRESDARFEGRLDNLLKEHGGFRAGWQEVMPRLDRVVATNKDEFEQICEQVGVLLSQIDRHLRREADLLAEASLLDLGGEG